MNNSIPRRKFLRTVAASAAAGAGSRALAARPLGTAGPSAQPRLFVGCCAYSYNKHLSKGPMTMENSVYNSWRFGTSRSITDLDG